MMELIYSDSARDLRVLRDTKVPPDLLALLESTIWGQRGVVFRSLDITHMLNDLVQPEFLRLVKGNTTIAAAVRNRKKVYMAGEKFDAVHLALFAVHPDFIRQGYGNILARFRETTISACWKSQASSTVISKAATRPSYGSILE